MNTGDIRAGSPWTVRPEEARDVPVVQALVGEAFGGSEVPALLLEMRGDHCWRDLSFVVAPASDPHTIAGHVSFTRGWIDAPEALAEVLVLSPMSIHPAWQRRGAGSTLIRESLARLQDRREPLVFLEGSPDYYGRLGFRPALAEGFLRPSPRIPEAAFQLWRLADREADLTGALVYPDVFWRHDAVGLR